MTTDPSPILVAGQWRAAASAGEYRSIDPTTAIPFGPAFPISAWSDVDAALAAAYAAPALDRERRAAFLDAYAAKIEATTADLAAIAASETALPADARFAKVEIPRTVNQLRQAATSVRSGDWSMPTIDSKLNIRSCLGPIGPVVVFGPANFPFAYNAISGGDFASAIAAGNPVIGRAHPSHPQTTLALAKLLVEASKEAGIATPPAQLLFGFSNEDGIRLAKDRRLAAIGFTGSRHGGLALKAACDSAGVLFYGELSSINPVVITPDALAERGDAILDQYVGSVLAATGQFCTNPGLVVLVAGDSTTRFVDSVIDRFTTTPPGVLLNENIWKNLKTNVAKVMTAGAMPLCGATPADGYRFANTLLQVSDVRFCNAPEIFQTEMFGNAALFVVCESLASAAKVVSLLEGNLCGSIYLGANESATPEILDLSAKLRKKVGRLLNDKMPTGVAVTGAMNHGGPYPSTGHPGFTAVGFPGAIRRFGKLDCYDNVRAELLPDVLRDDNPTQAWRLVDGVPTRDAIGATRVG